MIQWMLAIWSLVPLPFLKPAWTFFKFIHVVWVSGSFCFIAKFIPLQTFAMFAKCLQTLQTFHPTFYVNFLKVFIELLKYCFCFMFSYFGQETCGILNSWPGIKLVPPALVGEALITGLPGKSQNIRYFKIHSSGDGHGLGSSLGIWMNE